MEETWPVLPHRNWDEIWTLVSNTWDEVISSQRYVKLLIESMTRQMKSVVEARGLWASYLGQILKTDIIRDKVFSFCMRKRVTSRNKSLNRAFCAQVYEIGG